MATKGAFTVVQPAFGLRSMATCAGGPLATLALRRSVWELDPPSDHANDLGNDIAGETLGNQPVSQPTDPAARAGRAPACSAAV